MHRNQNFQDPRGTNLQDGNDVGGSMVQDHLKTSKNNEEQPDGGQLIPCLANQSIFAPDLSQQQQWFGALLAQLAQSSQKINVPGASSSSVFS